MNIEQARSGIEDAAAFIRKQPHAPHCASQFGDEDERCTCGRDDLLDGLHNSQEWLTKASTSEGDQLSEEEIQRLIPDAGTHFPVPGDPNKDHYFLLMFCESCGWIGSQQLCRWDGLSNDDDGAHHCPKCDQHVDEAWDEVVRAARASLRDHGIRRFIDVEGKHPSSVKGIGVEEIDNALDILQKLKAQAPTRVAMNEWDGVAITEYVRVAIAELEDFKARVAKLLSPDQPH